MVLKYPDLVNTLLMNKKDIVKNLSKDSNLSLNDASKLIESVLSMIKVNSKKSHVKLGGFGTFSFKSTTKRIGRNPSTKESYIIPTFMKLNFKASNKIRNILN